MIIKADHKIGTNETDHIGPRSRISSNHIALRVLPPTNANATQHHHRKQQQQGVHRLSLLHNERTVQSKSIHKRTHTPIICVCMQHLHCSERAIRVGERRRSSGEQHTPEDHVARARLYKQRSAIPRRHHQHYFRCYQCFGHIHITEVHFSRIYKPFIFFQTKTTTNFVVFLRYSSHCAK